MTRLALATAAAVLATAPASATAQDEDGLPDATAMNRLAADAPAQPWYPDGYYDVRLAAEAEVSESPRGPESYIDSCPDGGGQCHDIVDPLPRRIDPSENDPTVRRYGNVALDVSRLRQELARTGFPATLYSGPLSDYEKSQVEAANGGSAASGSATDALRTLAAAVEANRSAQAPDLPRVVAASDAAQAIVVGSAGPSAGLYPRGKKLARGSRLTLKVGDKVELLTPEGARTLTGPGTYSVDQPVAGVLGALLTSPAPRRAVGAVRGGSIGGVTVETNPPSGEVLLLSAFAFRVCQRKQPDPWDRFQCRWNEIETGVANPLSGRFVYQVRWPDGTVRKGTREIAPGQSGAVSFKKVGS